MLSRSLRAARPLTRSLRHSPIATTSISKPQLRWLSGSTDDPQMLGDYVNPPAIKRQHRDPYADWWDKQERRNFNEPVHEDNDILGIFSTEDYTHFTPAWGGVLWIGVVTTVLGLMGVVYQYYPDKPSAPRTFPGGLEKELGGPNAISERLPEDS